MERSNPRSSRTVGDVCAEIARGGAIPYAGRRFARWFAGLLEWPPDLFALTSVILADSGAYRLAVSPPGSKRWPPRDPARWNGYVRRLGAAYRRWVLSGRSPPAALRKLGAVVRDSRAVRLADLCNPEHWRLAVALLELHAAADEASAGMGIPEYRLDRPFDLFVYEANRRLVRTGSLARVSPDVARVLPKLRTPQIGISLRSLSHHLAVHRNEVDVRWELLEGIGPSGDGRLNLLVLPFPTQVDASAFHEVEGPLANMNTEKFGFFRFSPTQRCDPDWLRSVVQAAKRRAGRVDGVVLPECALASDEVDTVERVLVAEQVPLLLAGIRGDRSNEALLGMYYGEVWRRSSQAKHHRWCIDQPQIQQYDLGATLHPSRRWWEDIEVRRRSLRFVTTSSGLTICHLICEDLARQDPVAQVVRAVGPTLVLALLLDGPQLKSRWAPRYAGVLADDPGSSVLSVTSLGMALRSRPDGAASSRAIAYWKDPRQGQREIHLDATSAGVVLALCAIDGVEEYSADGRSDGGATTHLVLAGIEQVPEPAPRMGASGSPPVRVKQIGGPSSGRARRTAPTPQAPARAR